MNVKVYYSWHDAIAHGAYASMLKLSRIFCYTLKMTSALLFGFIGILSTGIIGIHFFQLSIAEIGISVLVSNLAGFVALLMTLQIERFLKGWFQGSLKSWAILVSLYYGILLAGSPVLRDWKILAYLSFPLIFSTGFAILFFGPVRDRMVRHQQRKAQRLSESATPQKDNFRCFPTDSAVL